MVTGRPDGGGVDEACAQANLNDLASRGREAVRTLRARVQELLTEGAADRHRAAHYRRDETGKRDRLGCLGFKRTLAQ